MTLTRIVAAIVDTQKLTVYKENGDKIEIPQGDVRVKRIIDAVTEPLVAQGWADVDIGYANEGGNAYKDVEEKSSGLVRFFRATKKAIADFFNPEKDGKAVEPVELGHVPTDAPIPTVEVNKPIRTMDPHPNVKAASTPEKVQDATPHVKKDTRSAVEEIMRNAKPVTAKDFDSRAHDAKNETMIAVVDTPNGPAIVPGVENLENHLRQAAKLGSTVGVQRFLERLGAVIGDRGHSVQELLNFMSKGDLPIADDGCIVGYKVLRSTRKEAHYIDPNDPMPVPTKGYYVDCHSGRVLQRVGSLVQQKTVDPSRRTQCSTGLHIARRQYLRGFSGDIITLVKIAPEDVIAVPEGEPDKMRARAYHILGEIPKNEHDRLRNNQPIEGMVAKQMLGMALRGEHIGIIEDVIIGGAMGKGIEVVLRQDAKVTQQPKITKDTVAAEPIADPEQKVGFAPVDAKQVSEQVNQKKMTPAEITKQEEAVSAITPIVEAVAEADEPVLVASEPVPESRSMKIKRLVAELRQATDTTKKVGLAQELLAIAKTARKTLLGLGVSDADYVMVKQFAEGGPTPTPASKVKNVNKSPAVKGESPEAKEVAATHAKTSAQQKAINDLVAKAQKGDRKAYQDLLSRKKKAKKSWTALGVSNFETIQAKFES